MIDDELDYQPYKDEVSLETVQWALALKPGDKVLTKWDGRSLPENAHDWKEVTVVTVQDFAPSASGILVELKELTTSNFDGLVDINWIKPIE